MPCAAHNSTAFKVLELHQLLNRATLPRERETLAVLNTAAAGKLSASLPGKVRPSREPPTPASVSESGSALSQASSTVDEGVLAVPPPVLSAGESQHQFGRPRRQRLERLHSIWRRVLEGQQPVGGRITSADCLRSAEVCPVLSAVAAREESCQPDSAPAQQVRCHCSQRSRACYTLHVDFSHVSAHLQVSSGLEAIVFPCSCLPLPAPLVRLPAVYLWQLKLLQWYTKSC